MTRPSRGAALVASVRAEMQLHNCVPTATEEELLRVAATLADRVERLEAIIARDGEMITSPTGTLKTHPALVEHRQQAATLARVLGAIYVGDDAGGKKNPTRQRAARRRWDKESPEAA